MEDGDFVRTLKPWARRQCWRFEPQVEIIGERGELIGAYELTLLMARVLQNPEILAIPTFEDLPKLQLQVLGRGSAVVGERSDDKWWYLFIKI
jgi:hypothetical protein